MGRRKTEKAKIHYYLDTDKIAEEEMYDGLYAVCTDLLDDNVADILKVSEGRWQIEDCFRTMKTDFEARPVYLNREDRIKAHFLTCFLALLHFRLLNRSLKGTYTTEQLLHTLKDIKFTDIEEQGFMPVYERQEITDDLHETCGFRTDYQFITKRKIKGIQKKTLNFVKHIGIYKTLCQQGLFFVYKESGLIYSFILIRSL